MTGVRAGKVHTLVQLDCKFGRNIPWAAVLWAEHVSISTGLRGHAPPHAHPTPGPPCSGCGRRP
eukprot:scaffold39107_cov61-Phaeocystis_antarctica.AAC.6